jgi:hypothetical protein
MKRFLPFFLFILVLVSCERPATLSSLPPVDTLQPTMTLSIEPTAVTESTSTLPTQMVSPTPYPRLDFSTLPTKLPSSTKGYELLSWQVGDEWVFALITGTNRNKTFEEIMIPKNEFTSDGFVKLTVAGVEDFKKVIDRLPANEWVMWGGMDLQGEVPSGTLYFAFPPQALIDDLIAYAKIHHVTLTSLKAP